MASTPSSHLVLARKWRPDRFSELVGQEHVTRTLVQALKSGRIAHAFLFTGIRGVGKTTAARILARCLNCEQGPTPEPCGQCAACTEVRAGTALDVAEIDGATYRMIDDARAIIENLSYRPARDRFKIYIIDEAHQLTDQAFNALLKTLEEPPPHVKFILATTEPQKMPETILSRLQRYDFRRIPLATIFARLKELAGREGADAEESAIMMLAREAGGSMRDAERMLETAIACAPGGKVVEADIAATLGVASRSIVYALAESILNKDAAAALGKVRELHARGANLESLGRDLLEAIRNLAVAKLPAGDGASSPLADLPDHEAAELRRIAARASNRDLMRLFRLMSETQEDILRSPYPDLLMEMGVIRMATIAPVMDPDELMRAISAAPSGSGTPSTGPGGATSGTGSESAPAPSRRIKVAGEVKAEAPARPVVSSAPSSPPAQQPSQPAATDLPDLRTHIRNRRPALGGFMEQGARLALVGDTLSVAPRSDIYTRYLNDNRAAIAELATEFYGRPMKVEMSVAAAPASGANVASQPATPSSQNGEPPKREIPPARTAPATQSLPSNGSAESPARPDDTNKGRTATADERQALLGDPAIRRIFDVLEARLVEIRVQPESKAQAEGNEGDNDNQDRNS
ncbi:MAG TPA: DNA polymerase III subunit gamma/tau [Candidatus Binataceae bacterium]|nr:DNA polymerase III subunit gamma/tau [Candidatus Binataceae bacterium]